MSKIWLILDCFSKYENNEITENELIKLINLITSLNKSKKIKLYDVNIIVLLRIIADSIYVYNFDVKKMNDSQIICLATLIISTNIPMATEAASFLLTCIKLSRHNIRTIYRTYKHNCLIKLL